ncbi:pimeloyl-ACP methyl ester carboxylesterase [Novosphingobium sp. PhB165]|uniref:epoxide hydrolase family protein n=1 Tax=Novosphingobium sp. PhB165 TaxID=2485105 RepID=UPI00104DC55F|nr:epoxide hydrolase family protein [Novosphingobium sp. PhB165]TCM16553.1 pimeloyl-ACP methyl ester carboxylesterase [Novosphingobium sp. PhB165]
MTLMSSPPGDIEADRRHFLGGALTAAGAAVVLPGVTQARLADGHSQPLLPAASDVVTPFRVEVEDTELRQLRQRLALTRWPEPETVNDWTQGAPLNATRALVDYWRTGYDPTRLARQLNALPQFRTRIDGLGIHFIHVRSRHPQARPIILTHGWPGSIVEFLEVIGPMTDPTAHGGKAEDAFHVVIPSLPGFGFSDKPTERGWGLPRIARAWGTLMNRLGYDRYLAQGGDWGAGVTTWMAKQHVPGLAGVHLNLPILFPPPLAGAPTAEEQASIAQLVAYSTDESGYALLQGTRPQTIGYALADSPAGQAAWIYEKLAAWSDSGHHPEQEIGRDRMLDNIMLYWLTDSAASSARLYAESFTTDFSPQKLDIPVAVSVFPGEIFRPLKVWGERVYSKLTYWNEAPHGGHFAAFEQPEIFTEELRRAAPTLW